MGKEGQMVEKGEGGLGIRDERCGKDRPRQETDCKKSAGEKKVVGARGREKQGKILMKRKFGGLRNTGERIQLPTRLKRKAEARIGGKWQGEIGLG